jgi:hypothetical protein
MKILLIIFLIQSLYAVAPDEDSIRNLQKENKSNFNFINIIISNMVKPQAEADKLTDYQNLKIKPEAAAKRTLDKNDSFYFTKFLEANIKDNEGSMLYLKGEYDLAHKPLRESQEKIKELYEDALEKHNEHTRVLLSYIGTRIIKTDDFSSKYLLRLAFRELAIAEDSYTLGWNQAPYQFRNKINYYKEGFYSSRKARRFALLALINFKTYKDDKPIYKKQSLSELQNSVNEGRVNDYEYLKTTLRNLIENKLIESKISTSVGFPRPKTATDYEFKPNTGTAIDIMEIHDDNYNVITYNRISILEETNNIIRKDSPGPTYVDPNSKTTQNPVNNTPNNSESKEPAKTN